MTTRVPAVPPYDPAPTLAALAAHAVPGLEEVDVAAGSCTRVLVGPGGPAEVTVTLDEEGASVDRPDLVPLMRWWFDLGSDPSALVAGLGDDPVVGPLVRRRPGVRVLRHPDGFEAAVSTVTGQQVSVAAARTVVGRLVETWGGRVPGTRLRTFPDAGTLAALDPSQIRSTVGLTGARARTLHALAVAVADGLRIGPDGDPVDVRRRLLALPGVGPWTAEYLALRAVGDDDAFPAGDLVLQRALGVSTRRAAERASEAWSPWRGRAAVHLWTEAVYAA